MKALRHLLPLMVIAFSLHTFRSVGSPLHDLIPVFFRHLGEGFKTLHHNLITPGAGEEQFPSIVQEALALERKYNIPDYFHSQVIEEGTLEFSFIRDASYPRQAKAASKFIFIGINETSPCPLLEARQEIQLVQCP